MLGIDAYRFRVEASEFLPNPSYKTYDGITPNGLLNLGVLQDPYAPVFASKPHFLDCDPSLRTNMEGIREADRSVDDIFVDIEPVYMKKLFNCLPLLCCLSDYWFHSLCPPATSN